MGSDHCPILLEAGKPVEEKFTDCEGAVKPSRPIKVYFLLHYQNQYHNKPDIAWYGIDTVFPSKSKEEERRGMIWLSKNLVDMLHDEIQPSNFQGCVKKRIVRILLDHGLRKVIIY
jgi:hypothetical protein